MACPLDPCLASLKLTAVGSPLVCCSSHVFAGVDPSIFIAPIRLHLTLGVMRLAETPPSTRHGRQSAPLPTVDQAVELLQSCLEPVQEVLAGKPLQVRFRGLASFQQRPDKCHVLYAVPEDAVAEDGRLRSVCGQSFDLLVSHRLDRSSRPEPIRLNGAAFQDIVFYRFRQAGFILDNARDYKLHLTLMNTSHRKSQTRGVKLPKRRIPFDASSLFNANQSGSAWDFGTYLAPELCIARMGSHAQTGAYVTFGGISLLPPLEEDQRNALDAVS